MGFFDAHKQVSHVEFKKALWKLKDHGFSHADIDRVQNVFHGDLHESGVGAGISKHEMEKGLEWLRGHHDIHNFSPHHVDKIEHVLGQYL